jgi:hypothetical protein
MKRKPSLTEDSGTIMRRSNKRKVVEPSQPSQVIKELDNIYVRKKKHTKAS